MEVKKSLFVKALGAVGRLGVRLPNAILPRKATINLAGVRMEICPRDDIGYQLYTSQSFELSEILAATAMVLSLEQREETDIIVDIGANIGTHSLLWAKSCPNAKVHAFEPSPETFRRLENHVDSNGLRSQISTHNLAAGSVNGMLPFYVAEDSAYSGLKNTERRSLNEVIQVPVVRIDDWAKEHSANNVLDNIRLIKIDVEGLESDVLRGAAGLIEKHRPILMIEIYGGANSNENPDDTLELMREMNYRPYTLQSGLLLPFDGTHNDKLYSYIFFPSPND